MYSWNSLANVLYIESPAGAGFSYSDNNDYRTSDNESFKFIYEALVDFFKKYPQFSENEFYLTGESYAAVYLSLLAIKLLSDQRYKKINLKGLAIGNGALDDQILAQSFLFVAHYHGIIDSRAFDDLKSECCSCQRNEQKCAFPVLNSHGNIVSPRPSCTKKFSKIIRTLLIQYFYNIHDSCPKFGSQNKTLIDDFYTKKNLCPYE